MREKRRWDQTLFASFSLTVLAAVFAYFLRIHAFGMDESGYLFWKALTIAIALGLWTVAKFALGIRD